MQPGLVVLFGSGETSATGRRVWDWLFKQLDQPIRVAILETPAGFQPNSDRVAGQVAEFLRQRLQNYEPEINTIPARKRGTPHSPDNPDILQPMLTSNVFFLGAGSPTYAVRQLEASLAWQLLTAGHALGDAVVLASAAVLAAGAFTLPVYEIYKVGEDLHWHTGLDFLARYGLSPVFVPHWNNAEGGAELDTSRCFMGQARFAELRRMLPDDAIIVGLDEHTALILDPAAGLCRVMGRGSVTLLTSASESIFRAGDTFELGLLGPWHLPDPPAADIPGEILEMIQQARRPNEKVVTPPPEVLILVEKRQTARMRKDWATADRLRDEIAARGWRVADTSNGPQLEPAEEAQ